MRSRMEPCRRESLRTGPGFGDLLRKSSRPLAYPLHSVYLKVHLVERPDRGDPAIDFAGVYEGRFSSPFETARRRLWMSLMTLRCSLRARWIGLAFGRGFFESLTKFLVGLLKTLAMTRAVAAGLTDDEAEGGGEHHPYGYEVCWVFDHATFSDGWLFVEDAVDGGPGDPVSLGDLAQAVAVLAIAKDGLAIEIERPAADVTAFEAGAPHAGAHPLDDQVAFEFGDGADDDHDGAAQRAAGVDLLAEAERTRC